MADFVFDIDGTLADATHRLHWINNPAYFKGGKKNWDEFLKSERVAQDTPIAPTWLILTELVRSGNRIIFITGRPEREREMTYNWLRDSLCPTRFEAHYYWENCPSSRKPVIYMCSDGDRRPSSVVKGELLDKAREDGFNPIAAFEDRRDDCRMWREKGLLCYHVAEGDY